mgnify:CR=1 FL=1
MSASPQQQTDTSMTQTKVDFNNNNEQLKRIDISEYLDEDFFKFLVDFTQKTHKRGGNIVSLHDFANAISQESEIINFKKENDKDIQNFLDSVGNGPFTENTSKNIIMIDPALKEQILESYTLGLRNNESMVTKTSFWKSLIRVTETKEINKFKNELPNLSKYMSLIDEKNNEIPLVDRDNEVNIIIRTLMKADKNHIILVGDYGIGKTAIVKKLVLSLKANQNISEVWKQYSILTVDFPEILSIAQYQEGAFKTFIKELGSVSNKIFYFPNIDLEPIGKDPLIIEYIFNSFSKNTSNRIIIGSSHVTFQTILQRINSFVKNYETLTIEEVSAPVLEEIINNQLKYYSEIDKITFSEHFATELIEYSGRFIPSKAFPQKCINLLDEVVVESKLKDVTELSINEIKTVLAEKTGIPIQTLSVGERESLLNLEGELKKVIVGQEIAVKRVVQSIQRSRVGLKNPNKPIGSFLFIGPSGVGKTELAKQIARIYFNDENAFMRFDMSEYSESHTGQKLIGSPPGYTGYEEGGILTNFVMKKPYCLLLFDEVEKAHPKIYDLFLQILDEGRLTDSKGNLVNFKNTILIFTSNFGSDIISKEASDTNSLLYTAPKRFFDENIMPLLSDYLRIEFINRFDEVIPFLLLDKQRIFEILKLKIAKLRTELEKQGFKIEFDELDLQKLAELSYDPKFGAREIDRVVKTYIENPLTENLLKNNIAKGQTIYWKMDK